MEFSIKFAVLPIFFPLDTGEGTHASLIYDGLPAEILVKPFSILKDMSQQISNI